MLHEVYAPENTADIVWSHQKKNAFLRLISDIQTGVQLPTVLLLYGPAGSGKLSSVCTILKELLGKVEVMHSCEVAPQQYYQFLMDTFTQDNSRIVGGGGGGLGFKQELNNNISSTGLRVSHKKNEMYNKRQKKEKNEVVAGTSSSLLLSSESVSKLSSFQKENSNRHVARIIKFYGEPLTSTLHALTIRFLDYYETYRRKILPGNGLNINSSNNNNNNSVSGTEMEDTSDFLLRRHFIVFIATTHDTHSDKVALGKLFPSRLLTHSCIRLFYCTPLTPRNMTSRIKDILHMELRRQKRSLKEINFSDEDLELLCEYSHGDIRHALLQVQWYLLTCRSSKGKDQSLSSEEEDEEREGEEERKIQKKRKKSRLKLKKKIKSVMDLIDDSDNESGINSTPPTKESSLSSSSLFSNFKKKGNTECIEKSDILFRDEYLDVAHATARILTQKYTIASVAEELNVEPHKLLGYITNNMPLYFNSNQINAYASCAAAASASDAMRAVNSFNRWRRSTNNEQLHTSRLTSEDETDGTGDIAIELIALILFGATYIVEHKEVYIPHAFVAQRPPPYQPNAYPRLRDITNLTRKRARVENFINNEEDELLEFKRKQGFTLFTSEGEWRRDFLRRLQLHASNIGESKRLYGSIIDIIRESLPALVNRCGSLDAILLEYTPYAQYIVLDRVYKNKNISNNFGNKSDNNSYIMEKDKLGFFKNSSSTTKLVESNIKNNLKPISNFVGPKKTLFSFTSTVTPPPPPPTSTSTSSFPLFPPPTLLQKRLCSQLRYNILCSSLTEKLPIRSDFFMLETNEENDDYDYDFQTMYAEDSNDPYLLIPDGEDIEDYSD